MSDPVLDSRNSTVNKTRSLPSRISKSSGEGKKKTGKKIYL